MIQCAGVWFPQNENHLIGMVRQSPTVNGRGTYQIHKYWRAMEFVRPERRGALDIGAHVGLWTRVMATNFQEVVCFEPTPAHIDCWNKNCADLQNVVLVEAAVGEVAGEVGLDLYPGNTGHTQISVDPTAKHIARMVRIDDMVREDYPIDFIKIDVEGYELFAARGAERTILRNRPCIIVEQKANNAEKFGNHRFAALQYLKSLGAVERDVISGDYILSWD